MCIRDSRRDNDIPYSWGTAVNVQMMAFGNMGDDCGTGVAFTRDPATGENGLFGEFLTNAQGEDVVAGCLLYTSGVCPLFFPTKSGLKISIKTDSRAQQKTIYMKC